ncbi:NAD-dependent epimerase/dehydratase family protein [Terrisporobacter glycolicus]|uniref:NAD-dependent epimerase/dehydratase domain-containing protein n=1 Tax=Terrisporobacter glycolicus ATCC 14880 = DSM 1288 TaxID=1121315 RepID=A0ABZ2EZQ8_9FIRM|nr:NAD-dependent epimerase/dehydratase family protein [Terrisporobacter glycolicus]
MCSVLIMGGSDFISSSLAKYLIKSKYNVDIITKDIKKINFNGINKHLICDRNNLDEVKNILKDKKYDYVYDISIRNKEDAEILIDNLDNESLKKYIVILSQENHIKEEVLNIENFIQNTSIPYIIIRPSHIYGDKSKVSKESYFFHKIEKSIEIVIPKNSNLKAQFIYIDDFIKVLFSLLKTNHVREIYNVTNPQVISLEECIKICSEIIGKEANIKYTDSNIVDTDIKQIFGGNYLDIDKIIQHGLYIPNVLLNNGVEILYSWYKRTYQEKISIKNKIEKVLQIG